MKANSKKMRRSRALLLGMALLCTTVLRAEGIDRIEPPCWWVGMNTDLQLMLHGKNIAGSTVSTDAAVKGLSVGKVTSVDSPDYLFVEVKVSSRLAPGTYTFNVMTADGRQIDFDYVIDKRREGSAKRASFGPVRAESAACVP